MASGWGGSPDGWVSPEEQAERKAAAEAAQKMAEARAADDRRTAALADAIRTGLYEIADAIRDAARLTDSELATSHDNSRHAAEAYGDVPDGMRTRVEVDPVCMCPSGGHKTYVGCPVHGGGRVYVDSAAGGAWLSGADDPEVDALLDPETNDAPESEDPSASPDDNRK